MTTSTTSPNPADNPIRLAAAAALADVDALGVQGDDRKIVLKALLDARLPDAKSPARPPKPSFQGGLAVDLDANVGDGALDEGDRIGKICHALKVDRDLVDLVYAMKDGEPHVVISARRLGNNKAQGARQLAHLVATARQAGGLEEWTSIEELRKVVTEYGRYDSANFATTIQQMDKVALVRGKGQQREIKVTRPGLEAAADLIRTLVGSEA